MTGLKLAPVCTEYSTHNINGYLAGKKNLTKGSHYSAIPVHVLRTHKYVIYVYILSHPEVPHSFLTLCCSAVADIF